MRKEICKGCQVAECMFIVKGREELCPCIECLVKVVCQAWCIVRIRSLHLIPITTESIASAIINGKICEFRKRKFRYGV